MDAQTIIDKMQDQIKRLEALKMAEIKKLSKLDYDQKLAALEQAGIKIAKRENSRFYNLIDSDGSLLAVTVYKKGALAVGYALACARAAAIPQIAAVVA